MSMILKRIFLLIKIKAAPGGRRHRIKKNGPVLN